MTQVMASAKHSGHLAAAFLISENGEMVFWFVSDHEAPF